MEGAKTPTELDRAALRPSLGRGIISSRQVSYCGQAGTPAGQSAHRRGPRETSAPLPRFPQQSDCGENKGAERRALHPRAAKKEIQGLFALAPGSCVTANPALGRCHSFAPRRTDFRHPEQIQPRARAGFWKGLPLFFSRSGPTCPVIGFPVRSEGTRPPVRRNGSQGRASAPRLAKRGALLSDSVLERENTEERERTFQTGSIYATGGKDPPRQRALGGNRR